MFKNDIYNLTSPQKNIWELEQINGSGTSINHIMSVLKLKGNLNENILVKTINKIIENNDSFRIKFIKSGNELHQSIDAYKFCQIDVRHLDIDDIQDLIDEYQNLKLTIDKLFSFCLVFSPNYTYVIYKTHHIISDAWGATQVAEQIKVFYEKLLNNEPDESFYKPSYTEFINRESLYYESKKYIIDEEFWSNYVLNLHPTKLFKTNDFSKDAKRYSAPIDDDVFSSITKYCKKNKITEYSFFLGILSLFFSKIYNSQNIVFGTTFLNRQKRFNELNTIGMFVSTLPLAVNVDIKDTFVSLCKKITSTNLFIFKHSSFPYHKIQELYYDYKKENTALYEIGFSYQINKQEKSMENNDLGECSWLFSGKQNNPLTIHLTTLNNKKVINYDYLLSCLNEDEIIKMNNIITHLVTQVLNEKENYFDISVLTNNDIKDLSILNDSGIIENSDNTIIDIFDSIVNDYPDNVALICDDISVTYSELNIRINNLAEELLTYGVTKNTPVVLFFDKSIEMIVSIFAVLKAGGCYVPILPDEDSARIDYILQDCRPKCILTHKNYDKQITWPINIINVDTLDLNNFYASSVLSYLNIRTIFPEDIAYIIYTSGSTGNPKGTMVMHKNICSLKNSIEHDHILKASSQDVSISLLKYSFDASGIDIYSSLLFGGKLILVKKEDELNPEKVVRIMEKERVTRSFLIPKWIEHIAIQDKLLDCDLSNLKILGTGGEVLKPYVIENLLAKYSNLKVLNLYGPTEATLFTTYKDVGIYEIKNNYTTIGKPIYGARLGVVNSNCELLPINCKGELIIYEDEFSIKNISRGYLNLPEQTQNRFVEIYNPIFNKNVKAYKTGDLTKINKNLEIEFIGRNDDVVKVNGGYLVALNEVENKIQNILGNEFEVYPIAIPYKNTKAIILFLTTNENNIDLNNIKNYINKNISFYMKPKKIIKLEEFPRNASGKINRSELKRIAIEDLEDSNNKSIMPKTKTEIEIYNYLKELLGSSEISITDDFMDDLGIDSLTLTAIYTYLEKYNITIQDIYNNSNIKDLANFINSNIPIEINPDLTNIYDATILNNVTKFDLTTILLTGVTGFLGIHVLRDLLLNDSIKKIYCIIRNKINLNGKKRLTKMIEFYFNSDEILLNLIDKKVIVINGDIAKDKLGLDKKTYSEISENVTSIINCAANVKHFAKPDQIRKDNVQSVMNLIELCNNKISLAHISTLSIAGYNGEDTQKKVFDENTLFINQKFNNNPYLVTKFEAEKNIIEATHNGLNAVIFRLGNIMPRISDGKFQQNANQNVFLGALKAIVDSKVIAKDFLNLNVEFSPVDVCSKMILSLLENYSSNSVYHILNDKEISIFEVKALLKLLDCDILDVDLKTFTDEVSKNSDEYIKEYILSNNLNQFSQETTLNLLQNLGQSWAPIDINYMEKILEIIKKAK